MGTPVEYAYNLALLVHISPRFVGGSCLCLIIIVYLDISLYSLNHQEIETFFQLLSGPNFERALRRISSSSSYEPEHCLN